MGHSSGELNVTLSTVGAFFDSLLSADGDRLASASFDGTVQLWDVDTGEAVR